MKRSPIRSEIKALMRNFRQDLQTGTVSAEFAFPADFTGFSGHFPGEPVLPGICQIQCVLELLSRSLNMVVNLISVDRAKFLNIVTPEEEIFVTGRFDRDENKVSGQFKISRKADISGNKKEVSVSRLKIVGILEQ